MKVTVAITTFNEKEEDINRLVDALLKQTLLPNEIIIVDADENSRLKDLKNFRQFKDLRIKVKNIKNISRAGGRNIAIKMAKNEIIALTDVGCVPRNDWLAKLVKPFTHLGGVKAHPRGVLPDVVAGFYEMTYRNSLQKAMRIFLGVLPSKFDDSFLPSARSMVLTKSIWKKVGGFTENLTGTAEDSLFNVNLIKAGAKFSRVKNAVVEWGTPKSIIDFGLKINEYAKGDAESKIWFHPVKHFKSHNIKILTVYLRYAFGLLLLFVSKPFFILYAIIYSLYAIRKAGIYGPLLQIISDFAVMSGFLRGIIHFK